MNRVKASFKQKNHTVTTLATNIFLKGTKSYRSGDNNNNNNNNNNNDIDNDNNNNDNNNNNIIINSERNKFIILSCAKRAQRVNRTLS